MCCRQYAMNMTITVPYLGLIATLVSELLNVFSGPDATTQALNEIKDKLNVMNSKLFAIDWKLDNVVDIVKDEIIINSCKTHIENLNLYNQCMKDMSLTQRLQLIQI